MKHKREIMQRRLERLETAMKAAKDQRARNVATIEWRAAMQAWSVLNPAPKLPKKTKAVATQPSLF